MLLALGDVRYQGRSEDMIQRELLSLAGAKLERLPATATEVRSIGRLFSEKSVVLTGESATEESLRNSDSEPVQDDSFCGAWICRQQISGEVSLGSDHEETPRRTGFSGPGDHEPGFLCGRSPSPAFGSGFGKLQGQEGLPASLRPS
jgi:hypothetical protein